jgi:cytochrome c
MRRRSHRVVAVLTLLVAVLGALLRSAPAIAESDAARPVWGAAAILAQATPEKGPTLVTPRGPSLMMPMMNSARGRKLFAEKGCVVCHSIRDVGGRVAMHLDAYTRPPFMNPFEFAAQMWRGAPAMITLQERNLGYQIKLTGEELADIIAFVHDHEEQQNFSEGDIPPEMRVLIPEE